MSRSASVEVAKPSAGDAIKDYISITKPKHQFVLLTCWATMVLAGSPSAAHVLTTLLATGLAVASSHVFNQIIDRDIDAVMTRTKDRALAAGRIRPVPAAIFGAVLLALSIAVMLWKVNALSAWLVVLGWVVYVPVYTYWLKRTSPWCTLVGGISGAVPTLIGWASVTGQIGLPAFWLFLFMVIWQSPHFYALSLFRGDDYKRARLPIYVVVAGVAKTQRRIVSYSLLMAAVTTLVYFSGAAGPVYLTLAAAGGAAYVLASIIAVRQGEAQAPEWGKRLFLSSYLYLALVFISVVADRT